MRVRKKSGGGGLYETSPRTERRIARARRKKEREAKKNPRQNLAPQNPRFLPPSQMTGEGSMSKAREKAEKKESRRVRRAERKRERGITTVSGRRGGNRDTTRQKPKKSLFGRNKGKGIKTPEPCLKPEKNC